MYIDSLTKLFEQLRDQDAIVWKGVVFDYGSLLDRVRYWERKLQDDKVGRGEVVILEADFSPNAVALFLALVGSGSVVVPLTSSVESKKQEFIRIAQGQVRVSIDSGDNVSIDRLAYDGDHPIYDTLRTTGHPGLVLFSSGSTGESKAAVHDMVGILAKFKIRRRRLRAITFLLFDHIGGVNTMLYQLSNGGCIVAIRDRDPDSVLAAIERHRVELLPTSPTFLNLVLLSQAHERHDLSSLETVTYGTEPMPESTLKRLHRVWPHVRLQQTYGLSEVGILRSKSKSSDSLWVRVGGEGFETRVVDGVLHIKAESVMLGYLNAPSPFTDDGWLNTGDLVEADGEFIRFLGRESDIINVGGEKVFPAEVESVIQEMENVSEVTVYGESNAIVGTIVCARVNLVGPEDQREFARRLKRFANGRLARYKVPVKVSITETPQHGERFKKLRRADAHAQA